MCRFYDDCGLYQLRTFLMKNSRLKGLSHYKVRKASCRHIEPAECFSYFNLLGIPLYLPAFNYVSCLFSFSYDRNPYLVLCVLRIRIQIKLYIRSISIFISGTREPLCYNTSFQLLNRPVITCSGEDRPRGCGHDICLKFFGFLCTGNSNEVFS